MRADLLVDWGGKKGRIQPQPKKMGRRWWATPGAEYTGD